MDTDVKTRIISFLGSSLDAGSKDSRKQRWRPNVGLGDASGHKVDELLLIHEPKHKNIAEQVRVDALEMARVAGNDFQVILKEVDFAPFDLLSTYLMMEDLRKEITFAPEDTHLLSISTGTHIMQICCFLMVESKRWPGYLVQCSRGEGVTTNLKIIDLDLSQHDPIMQRYRLDAMKGETLLKGGIPTLNEAFNRTVSKLQRVAERSDSPILFLGPTGAGKTQMARSVFEVKRKAKNLAGQFVEVNCATLRGDTVMSTLFGHKKGAFTGATESRDGLLKKADKGLLFLDEIGELGLEEQAMLLHALEDKSFSAMGSEDVVKSDFQFIAGTNRDLAAEVAAGRFREDLLARINTWTFDLPGLADRIEDLEPNIDFELAKQQAKHNVAYRFAGRARQDYLTFAKSKQATWAGNFRDLSASIQRMVVMAEGGLIGTEVVQDEIETLQSQWGPSTKMIQSAGSSIKGYLGQVDTTQLMPLEVVTLEHVLTVCAETDSYAELGRRLYGAQAGSNPSQRARKYLVGLGLDIKEVHAALRRA